MAFQTIGFIGLGLIGGSIAKKMKSNQPDIKIYATAHHKETIQEAYREDYRRRTGKEAESFCVL